jgi:hypothetical protein
VRIHEFIIDTIKEKNVFRDDEIRRIKEYFGCVKKNKYNDINEKSKGIIITMFEMCKEE